jgi:outer membrane protein assembly factor BamB
MADGRLYLYYYAPAGEEYDLPAEELAAKNAKSGGQRGAMLSVFKKEFWKYRCDDVVVCFDAATGQMLWKTVFPQNGYYASDSKPLMAGNTPVVRGGRIYGATGDHLLFCLDAKNGREIWRQPGPRHPGRMALLEQTLREKKYAGPGAGRNFQCNLAFAEGVFVVPAGGLIGPNGYIINEDPVSGKRFRNGGLWGVDAGTGAVLWKRDEKLISVMATPVTWLHGGHEYILAAAQRGLENDPTVLRLLHPRTGADLWTQTIGDNPVTPGVFGDMLFANIGFPPAQRGGKGTDQLACFRLSPSGMAKIWVAPEAHGFQRGYGLAQSGGCLVSLASKFTALDMATGKVIAEAEGRGALLEAAGEHLLVQTDTNHNTTVLDWWTFRDGKFAKRTGGWSPPHLQSGSYETPWVHPLVDGRLFARGAEGVYCYDLRAAPLRNFPVKAVDPKETGK